MKQYILDRHTTPGTPVMDQVPTEKIPVYDDQAAVEADLANLAVGQIGTTKDVGISSDIVEALKQYISDENELSDWEDITLSTDSNNPTLIQYDGFYIMSFSIHVNSGVPYQFYVNGVMIVQSGNGGGNYNSNDVEVMFPVKKGDLVYRTVGNQGPTQTQKIAYYKKRHYGYRQ